MTPFSGYLPRRAWCFRLSFLKSNRLLMSDLPIKMLPALQIQPSVLQYHKEHVPWVMVVARRNGP